MHSNPIPTMQKLQNDWIPAHWGNLVTGAVAALTIKEQVTCGTIDTFTHDKSIAWIFPHDSGPRKMCFLDDDPQVWLPRSNST